MRVEGRSLPEVRGEGAPFWEGCRRGELLYQVCRACGQRQVYPRAACGRCLSADLAWLPASGQGTVYAFTVVHRAFDPAFHSAVPYVVALVELEEGVRLMTNITGCNPGDVQVGMPVRVDFQKASAEVTLPFFRPV